MSIQNQQNQIFLSYKEENKGPDRLLSDKDQLILTVEKENRSISTTCPFSLSEISAIALCKCSGKNYKKDLNLIMSLDFPHSVKKKYREASYCYHSPSFQEFHIEKIKMELLSRFSLLFDESNINSKSLKMDSDISLNSQTILGPIFKRSLDFLENLELLHKNTDSFRYLLQTVVILKSNVCNPLFSFFPRKELTPDEISPLLEQKMLFIIWSFILCLKTQIYLINQFLINESYQINHPLEEEFVNYIYKELEFCFQIEKCLDELHSEKEQELDPLGNFRRLSKIEILEHMINMVKKLDKIRHKTQNGNFIFIIRCFTTDLNKIEDFNPQEIKKKISERFPFIKGRKNFKKILLDHSFSRTHLREKIEDLFIFCQDFTDIIHIKIPNCTDNRFEYFKSFSRWRLRLSQLNLYSAYFLRDLDLKYHFLKSSHNRESILHLVELIELLIVCFRVYLKAKILIFFQGKETRNTFFLEDLNKEWDSSIRLERSIAQFRSGAISIKELFEILNIY